MKESSFHIMEGGGGGGEYKSIKMLNIQQPMIKKSICSSKCHYLCYYFKDFACLFGCYNDDDDDGGGDDDDDDNNNNL